MLVEMIGGPMCGVLMEANAGDEIKFPILHGIDAIGVKEMDDMTELPSDVEYLVYIRGNESLSKCSAIKYFFKKYTWPEKPYYGGLGGY